MKKFLIVIGLFLVSAHIVNAASISVATSTIQGEPLKISITGVSGLNDISKLTFGGVTQKLFLFNNNPTAIIGIDIHKKTGEYPIILKLTDGTVFFSTTTILARETYQAPLGIPEKLGGNSTTSQQKLVTDLSKENAILVSLKTGLKAFWSKPFQYPVSNPIVTDPFGYSRLTGAYTITHLGTDFRAAEGTKVVAMNRGVVRLVRNSRVYGKEIAIDHGLGVITYYMHLSKIKVNAGELVLPGQVIGLSGQTGYAEHPHLHVSVKINTVSIDPIVFLNLFNE